MAVSVVVKVKPLSIASLFAHMMTTDVVKFSSMHAMVRVLCDCSIEEDIVMSSIGSVTKAAKMSVHSCSPQTWKRVLMHCS